MPKPLVATLVVSTWSTKCSWCGWQTRPAAVMHDAVPGRDESMQACGALFVSITTDGLELTEDARARLAEMRPDLPIVEYGDRVKRPLPGSGFPPPTKPRSSADDDD